MAAMSDAKKSDAPRDPVRRWTLIVLGLIVILFLYSLIADRLTPYTSQATVQAFVVRMAPEVAGLGITAPMLSDTDHTVSEDYDILQWAIASGEPGHTFVLVDGTGQVAWIRDYGSPDNPDQTMYVEPGKIVAQVRAALGSEGPDY